MASELEQRIAEQQNKLTQLADVETSLSKEIDRQRPVLEMLIKQRDSLTEEIDAANKRIEKKNSEVNENLNIREGAVTNREAQLEGDVAQLSKERDLFETNKKLFIEEVAKQDAISLGNDNKAKLLAEKSALLEQREEEIVHRESETNAKEIKNANMDEAIKKRQDELIFQADEIAAQAAKNKIAQKSLDDGSEEISKRAAELNELSKSILAKQSELNVTSGQIDLKLAQAKEHDYVYEMQLQTLAEEKKKIQLAWLQVNKKIQDNKLDLDLAELQK